MPHNDTTGNHQLPYHCPISAAQVFTVKPSTCHFKPHTSKYLPRTREIFAICWIILPAEIRLCFQGTEIQQICLPDCTLCIYPSVCMKMNLCLVSWQGALPTGRDTEAALKCEGFSFAFFKYYFVKLVYPNRSLFWKKTLFLRDKTSYFTKISKVKKQKHFGVYICSICTLIQDASQRRK